MSIDSDSKEKRKEEFDEIHVAPASESDGSSVREHRVFGSTSAEHRKLGQLLFSLFSTCSDDSKADELHLRRVL